MAECQSSKHSVAWSFPADTTLFHKQNWWWGDAGKVGKRQTAALSSCTHPHLGHNLNQNGSLWALTHGPFNVALLQQQLTWTSRHQKHFLLRYCFLTSGVRTTETYYPEHWFQQAHRPLQKPDGGGRAVLVENRLPHVAVKLLKKNFCSNPQTQTQQRTVPC